MKKLFLFGAALVLSCSALAQKTQTLGVAPGGDNPPLDTNPPATGWATAISSVFQYVDRAQVPSGLLEEYAFSNLDLGQYTGLTTTPDNAANLDRWRRGYGALYRSRFGPNAPAMPTLAQVNSTLRTYEADSLVELPVLYYRYNRYRADAVAQNLVQVQNSQIFDVAGRGQSPYEARTAFVVAPTQNVFATNQLRFVLRSALYYTNAGAPPSSVQIDFGDGRGYLPAAWDTPLAVSYPAVGEYELRFQFAYPDGSTLQSHALVRIDEMPAAARYFGGSSIPPFHLRADRTYVGANQAAGAEINVEYGAGPRVLDKPLIVVEGYDASGIVTDVPKYNYGRFILDVNEPGFLLNDGLSLDGYDIVFVDFDNGVDYIQNNAYLLQKVIAWVNQHKTGTEPNVVMGLSMGGLVAQYALRDLEVNGGPPHQVRLLITHDSPHRGANALLSAQAAVRHLAGLRISAPLPVPGSNNNSFSLIDELPELKQFYDLLLAPASQQLLTYTASGLGSDAGTVPVGSSLHDAWQTEYDNLGLPQGTAALPCRVIATSNGAECGRPQAFGPGARLATVSGGAEVFRFKWYYPFAVGYLLGPSALPLLPLIGAYDLHADFRLNALPDQQSQELYYAYLSIQKRKPILGLIPLSIQLFSKTVNSRPEMLPLDSAPGSVVGADPKLSGLEPSKLPAGISFNVGASYFCFVPTPSALNVPLTSTPVLYQSYSPSQRTVFGSPYANVITAGRENLYHIVYDAHNSNWLLNEIRSTPAVSNCLSFCQSPVGTISGQAGICFNTTATYSVTLSPGSVVDWRVFPGGRVTPNSAIGTAGTITLTPLTAGTLTLRATVRSECGQYDLPVRSLRVGAPSIPIVRSQDSNICTDNTNRYEIADFDPSLTYTVSATSGISVVGGSRLIRSGFALKATSSQVTGSFTVTAANNCGSISYSEDDIGFAECGSASDFAYSLFPNPATDEATVEQRTIGNLSSTSTGGIESVQVYDAYGQLRLTQPGQGATALRIRLHTLPAGLYMVHILRGQTVVSRHRLQVNR